MQWFLNNKKIIIAIFITLVVIGTIVAMAVTTERGNSSDLGQGTQSEQGQEPSDEGAELDDNENIKEDDSKGGLEAQNILDESSKESENSTSASGLWGDEDDTDAGETGTDDSNKDEDDDIAESDIIYGDIY